MFGLKAYGFSAVLVINRVSILAILAINRVWFFACFLKEATVSSLSIAPSRKALN